MLAWCQSPRASGDPDRNVNCLSLLGDALFRATTQGGGLMRLTLPDLLARLSAGEDLMLPALRPHQRPAWHAFTVQLAALAMEGAGLDAPPTDPHTWRELLRAMTAAFPGDEPWHLVVDDWTLPAFMQSPCAPGEQQKYGDATGSAQRLGWLSVSKNHDEKSEKLWPRISEESDVWIFSLLSLQGFAGRLGPGHWGSMRMNSGSGSRPQLRFTTGTAGGDFVRDLSILMAHIESIWEDAEAIGMGTREPHSLLWLSSWGEDPLLLEQVHPLCLEVTRRTRLRRGDRGFEMLRMGSPTARVSADGTRGLVLDPWIPIDKRKSPRSWTAQADGLSYARLAPVLFDDKQYTLPVMAKPTNAEANSGGELTLVIQVLVGGTSKTDGCLRRDISMSATTLREFATRRGELALRAQAFVELAGLAQGKVLRAALLQFVDSGDAVNWQNKDFGKAVTPWIEALERRIDDVFFTELFATETDPPMPDAEARAHWVAILRGLLDEVFDAATEALPSRDRSRHMARARAKRLLANAARTHLDGNGSVASGGDARPRARAAKRASQAIEGRS